MDIPARTTGRVRGTPPAMEVAARNLRQTMTPAEQALWVVLRNRQLGGLKFRRQQRLGAYVLDFVCPSCKLVVEVDGGIHDDDEQAAHDELRTQQLVALLPRASRPH